MRLQAISTILLALAMAGPAAAATERDVALMVRAVGFAESTPKGAVQAAVVDGPGADQIIAALGSGVSANGVTLTGRKVAASALAGSGAKVIIVPAGQSAAFATISAAARQLGALTISADMSCVRAGQCVVGATASPQVEIVVSRSAAAANAVTFASAFRVMIKEI